MDYADVKNVPVPSIQPLWLYGPQILCRCLPSMCDRATPSSCRRLIPSGLLRGDHQASFQPGTVLFCRPTSSSTRFAIFQRPYHLPSRLHDFWQLLRLAAHPWICNPGSSLCVVPLPLCRTPLPECFLENGWEQTVLQGPVDRCGPKVHVIMAGNLLRKPVLLQSTDDMLVIFWSHDLQLRLACLSCKACMNSELRRHCSRVSWYFYGVLG
jgi:hypothetical protein